MTLYELRDRLQAFDIRREVVAIIVELADEIVVLNQGQLFIGRRADGHEVEPAYTDYTVGQKIKKGQPFDRVILKDKGDFWNSIVVRNVTINGFIIDATDWKTDKLIKKYGGQILGLSQASKSEEFIPLYFHPKLKEMIIKKLGLKFS